MKWRVKDHQRPSNSSEILEDLRSGEHEFSRSDLMEKTVLWFLYVEQDMTTQAIFDYLSKRASKPFNQQDVTMACRWFGLIPTYGKPLQAQHRSICDVLSFGWEL